MKEAILSAYSNASKDLIKDVFHLSYFVNTDVRSFVESSPVQKGASSNFRFKVTFDDVNFTLYTGFTEKALDFFLQNAYDGLKQLKSEVDTTKLLTNIAGMILFRLQHDFRDKTQHIEYFLHEKQNLEQFTNVHEICSGFNEDSLILFLGFVIE